MLLVSFWLTVRPYTISIHFNLAWLIISVLKELLSPLAEGTFLNHSVNKSLVQIQLYESFKHLRAHMYIAFAQYNNTKKVESYFKKVVQRKKRITNVFVYLSTLLLFYEFNSSSCSVALLLSQPETAPMIINVEGRGQRRVTSFDYNLLLPLETPISTMDKRWQLQVGICTTGVSQSIEFDDVEGKSLRLKGYLFTAYEDIRKKRDVC